MKVRVFVAGLIVGALAALGVSTAFAAGSDPGDSKDRVTLNGIQLTGVHGEATDGRVVSNGTQRTGVRDSHDRYANQRV